MGRRKESEQPSFVYNADANGYNLSFTFFLFSPSAFRSCRASYIITHDGPCPVRDLCWDIHHLQNSPGKVRNEYAFAVFLTLPFSVALSFSLFVYFSLSFLSSFLYHYFTHLLSFFSIILTFSFNSFFSFPFFLSLTLSSFVFHSSGGPFSLLLSIPLSSFLFHFTACISISLFSFSFFVADSLSLCILSLSFFFFLYCFLFHFFFSI